jgi:hypothetical protein
MNKKLLGIAGAGFVLLGLFTSAGSASAATPGAPYDNTDPSSTGCSADGVTIASYPIKDPSNNVLGTVEVRYSATCNTNWVRVNNTVTGASADKYIERISSYNAGTNTGLPFTYTFAEDPGLGWSYGNQVGGASTNCINVWGRLVDSSGTIIANSGTHTVC